MKVVAVVILGSLIALTGKAALAAELRFAKGTGYDAVRAGLLKHGWKPMTLVPAGQCGVDAAACPTVPEVIFCAGANDASCFYAWQKGGKFIEIHANTEGRPQKYVATIICKSIDRGDPRYVTDWKCVK